MPLRNSPALVHLRQGLCADADRANAVLGTGYFGKGPPDTLLVELGAVKVIKESIAGFVVEDDDVAAVWLADDLESGPKVHLLYALVTLGPEEHVFPCLLLDDWGKEVTGLTVYEWIQTNGNAFPRAELFAVGRAGDERQHFLREFELYARYPVYALPSRSTPVANAVRIRAILRTDASTEEPARTKRPPDVTGPLSRALVGWWRVPSSQQGLGFLLAQNELS